MTTFVLPNSTPSCTVTIPSHIELTEENVLSFRPFREWTERLKKALASQSSPNHPFQGSPYELRAIRVQAVDLFGTRIGFLKIYADVKNSNGEKLPGAVFLRGASVAMMITIQPDDVPVGSEQDKSVILTIQPRVAGASMGFTELPAGMLDDGTFAGAAAKEIEEECDMKVEQSELINMSELAAKLNPSSSDEDVQDGVYPSIGACDEFIPIFLCQKRIPRGDLKKLDGKLTGLREENERITLKLVPLSDLWKVGSRDAKALAGAALYAGLKASEAI